MSTIFVAVDVETTGLNPDRDEMIEVAAITFQNYAILDEFATLLQPERPIPPEITQITGITQSMVADAPSLPHVRAKLNRIIGDHVLVGHNVGFDMGFLNTARIGVGNYRLDTITLASILLPEAGQYSLEALIQYLELPGAAAGQSHRAHDDAEQTIELFLALRDKAMQLSIDQLTEIIRAGQTIRWPEMLFFEEILQTKAQETGVSPRQGRLKKLFTPPKLNGRSLSPAEKVNEIDDAIVAAMIKPGGNFARAFPDFEYRPQQVAMLQAVVHAFNSGQHILVEAGTGTGKSMAYLIPAAFWANENSRRVVISTNTINLQDQLINKDLPELQRLLPFDLRAAVRKGRSNYLCTRLYQQMRHSGPNNADEMVLYARILLWLPHSETGDMAEIALRTPGERLAWLRMNGENPACTTDTCAAEGCPLHYARRRAELAHLLIVNHALLLSDVANNNHILPEFFDLIIDEAHHLEDAVTNGLTFRADRKFLEAILDDISKPRSGLIADIEKRVRDALPPLFGEKLDGVIQAMRRDGQTASGHVDDFFATLLYFLQDQISGQSKFAEQIRLTTAVRAQPDYDHLELSWDNLNHSLKAIAKRYEILAEALAELAENMDIEDADDLRLTLVSNGRSLEKTRIALHELISEPNESMIYWVESYKDRISLHAAPLHIGPLVEEHIFNAKETVILTSATLQTAGMQYDEGPSFNHIQDRLHATSTDTLTVGSPFDYKNATLLYLVSDIPEPNQPGYQRYLEEAIIDVATALNGRTLVLFTSYSHLNQTATGIRGVLREAGLNVLAQTSGSSRQQLLAAFKREDSRSVLLGTRSFWEGVDIPGPALQAVLIARLPFDVPSDPIYAARAETFDNAFFQYSVPETVLRFRQGFGRLIRRQTDEGVVVILDKRVLTKRYGQMFLDSLPECTVLRQRNGRLGELTLRWLNREKQEQT